MQLKRGERGFTLVELLITISLMGVVSLALADLVISALREMSATSDRMDLSQDAQLGAVYFAQDVAAVGLRDYSAVAVGTTLCRSSRRSSSNAADDAGGATCGPLPTSVLRLLSDDWTSVPTARRTAVVAYYLQGGDLHRATCLSPATDPSSDLVIVQDVVPGSVSVTCSTSCTAPALPVSITLALRGEQAIRRGLPDHPERTAETVVRGVAGRARASLLLVLVVISVVAVALSALLTRADSAQKVERVLRDQTAASYTADGAMQAAINNLRNSTYNGEQGQHCFGLSDTLSLPTFTPARNLLDFQLRSSDLYCGPEAGAWSTATDRDCNRPDNAILTSAASRARTGSRSTSRQTRPCASTARSSRTPRSTSRPASSARQAPCRHEASAQASPRHSATSASTHYLQATTRSTRRY